MNHDEIQMTVLKINHHSPQHCAERWPYAAYGSNLLHAQIIERCPHVGIEAVGTILQHKLVFARVATIVADTNSTVPVGLYRLSASDIATLDRREGLGRSYDRYLITPITEDGRALRCFTYIKRDSMLEPPTPEYYARIQQGYREWMLDDRRLRHARAAAERAWQDPKHRAEVERHHRQSKAVWGVIDTKPRTVMQAIHRTVARKPSKDERLKFEEDQRVPRYAMASHQNVEWGKRGEELFWRVRGTRTWYRDTSEAKDIQSGIVRGEFEKTLPGASAFKVVDGNTKGVRHDR